MKKIFILFLVSFLLITCKKVAFDILYVDAPAVTTDSVNNIKLDSATVYFKINNPSNFKFVKVGVCYDTSTNNPNINNMVQLTDSGVVKGNLKIPIANLKYKTKYYARGFAIFNDSIFYGNVQTFTTNTLPTIALNINNITNSSATINWVITNSNKTNITKVGIYYSTSNMLPGTNSNDSTKTLINTGALAGTYSLNLQNLITGSIYYIRYFYIINGVQYVSPQVQSFTAIILPTIATNTITNITKYTATTGITISNVGNVNIAAAGLCYSKTNTIPTLADSLKTLANTGVLNGIYPIYLSNLSFNTVYYVRSYYTVNGLTYYGNVQNFTTLQNIPQVQTDTAINITNNSATIKFIITNETALNITAAGIAYSSSNTSPTTASGYVAHSSTGNLAGNYTLNLSSLSANTIYYYRAYINYNGTIYYGATKMFSSNPNIPTITTNTTTSITQTTALASVNIANTSNVNITEIGFCCSKINNIPTIVDSIIILPNTGNLTGNYTTNVTNLSTNSLYYIRGYIKYNNAIYYGNVQNFTTLAIIPQVTTNAITSITNSTATANINISNPNGLSITATGVAYSSTNSTPTTANGYVAHSSTGNLAGNYTLPLSSLTANTTYYVRAYINYNGTIFYGAVQTFTTLPNPPTITTNAVTSITNTSATGNINISNPNGLSIAAAGIVYSNINNIPTISDNFIAHSSVGNLAGNYTINLSSLTASTTYYVRAYINYKGTIYYGALQTFTTLQNPPTITTNVVTNIASTTATANINISNPNGLSITAAGVAYSSTNSTPTTANGYVSLNNVGNLAGNYTLGLSSLTFNTTYYVRGYINFNGTIYYGAVQSFTTTNVLPNTLTLVNLEDNMVTVPAGSFIMGATSEQTADGYNPWWSPTTQQVTLSSYKICRFEVTQQLWQDVMGSNPSYFNGGSYSTNLQRPVELVTWDACQTFITRLNQLTGKNYRLPTEAEWEYAARGGANSTYSYIYSGGNTLNDIAWNGYNSSNQTHTIGSKQANALGLYDMSGNVWEWCNDWYGNYSSTAVTNPLGANLGSNRVLRGGSWIYDGSINRVSYRNYDNPSNPSIANYDHGLRLVSP